MTGIIGSCIWEALTVVAATVSQIICNNSKLCHCSLDNNPAKRKCGYRCANCLFTDILRSSHEDVINAKSYSKNNSLSPVNFLPMANAVLLFSLTGGMGDCHIPLRHTLYPASERCDFAWGLERCPLLLKTWLAETPGHWGKKTWQKGRDLLLAYQPVHTSMSIFSIEHD